MDPFHNGTLQLTTVAKEMDSVHLNQPEYHYKSHLLLWYSRSQGRKKVVNSGRAN